MEMILIRVLQYPLRAVWPTMRATASHHSCFPRTSRHMLLSGPCVVFRKFWGLIIFCQLGWPQKCKPMQNRSKSQLTGDSPASHVWLPEVNLDVLLQGQSKEDGEKVGCDSRALAEIETRIQSALVVCGLRFEGLANPGFEEPRSQCHPLPHYAANQCHTRLIGTSLSLANQNLNKGVVPVSDQWETLVVLVVPISDSFI